MEELLRKVEGYRQKIFEKNHFHHSRTQYKHSQPQQQEATCRPLRPGKTLRTVQSKQCGEILPSAALRFDCFLQVGAGGGGGPPAPASVALTYSSASVIVTSDRHHGPQAARYIQS